MTAEPPRPAPECITIGTAQLWHGDCRDVLPLLAPVSAVVTDPAYGLSFMGKRWDYDVPDSALWALVLDRLLPGGHLLAFAGTRTQHRMAARIEDAGFEIRDMLAWVYGSGFPKSLDVGKAIDKAAGAQREVVGPGMRHGGGIVGNGSSYEMSPDVPPITAHATDATRQLDGWGTALKPAMEPITLARKPLAGTVAANVQAHGTGGLNIDECRIPVDMTVDDPRLGGNGGWETSKMARNVYQGGYAGIRNSSHPIGRWPANLVHDGSAEVIALFPQALGQQRSVGPEHGPRGSINVYGDYGPRHTSNPRGDSGSAARFFYCAKASTSERGEGNEHPTVKPIALMRWLLTPVTPPGGVVLDPFLGSGSTGVAAAELGMRFVGIERERRYFDIACERIAAAQAQMPLFEPRPGTPASAAAAADGAPQLGMFDGAQPARQGGAA